MVGWHNSKQIFPYKNKILMNILDGRNSSNLAIGGSEKDCTNNLACMFKMYLILLGLLY